LQHWERLLEGMVGGVGRRIWELEMLGEEERRQVVEEWNRTRAVYEHDKCVHELFEEQVARTPERMAVVCEGERLTYLELNQRADQLASYLRDLGVGPEVRVGLCVERSVKMLVGLLAVWKAGGAYVPLDPGYPEERLRYMLEDSQTSVLLTQNHLRGKLPETSARIVTLDADWNPQRSSQREVMHGEQAAYVIYTSGSTGKPKGVVVSHRAVVNLLLSMQHATGLGMHDCFYSTTRLTFDIAALELYLPLLNGAQIQLAAEVVAVGPESGQRLQDAQATIVQATPSGWKFLLNTGWKGNRRMKLLCGGEDLQGELAAQLVDRGASLWNVYGPTETTIWSSIHQVREPAVGFTVPIGHPIANTQMYILDRCLQPVPLRVAGELYIGGSGLARGYLNRPDLTAERFVPNPFSEVGGERLYRTGDLARRRDDGDLEFLGRIDDQVKVRGYRIELGEIETMLRRHEEVGDAVVIVREDKPGEKRLVAYVVTRDGAIPDSEDLKRHLRERLPEYMVPGTFVQLGEMPLTSNGKLNRKGLPAPDRERPGRERGYVGPRTPTEEMLCGIWADVLRLERVGVDDNFFDLGGHSLLATQVASRILQMLGVDLELRWLFMKPTVSGLAEAVEEAQTQDVELNALLDEIENLPSKKIKDLLSKYQASESSY
jgi:amino acid adenylation domain-containing protein